MAGYVQDAIMLVGDSITDFGTEPYGFCQQLTTAYNRKLDVLVRGYSGYNTAWMLPVFEKLLAKRNERQNVPKIQLLTIWLGANDATFPGEVQHVPMYTYMANLSKMIRMIKDPSSEWYSPETRVVIITPPPVNGEQWLQFLRVNATPPRDTLDRNLARSRLYAQAARDVAKQEQVPVADVWTPLWEAAGEKEENLTKFLSDGLHLNMEGYKLVYDTLIKTILEHYPEIHYDTLDMAYPEWTTVTSDNYAELLKDSVIRKPRL